MATRKDARQQGSWSKWAAKGTALMLDSLGFVVAVGAMWALLVLVEGMTA